MNFAMMTAGFEDKLLKRPGESEFAPRGVLLLEGEAEEGFINVGAPEAVAALKVCPPGTLIFCAGSPPDLGIDCAAAALTPAELLNRLSKNLAEYNFWREALAEEGGTAGGFDRALERIARRSGVEAAVYGPAGRLIAGAAAEGAELRRVFVGASTVGFVSASGGARGEELLNLLLPRVREYLYANRSDGLPGDPEFQEFLTELMQSRPQEMDAAERKRKLMPSRPRKYARMLVVQPDGEETDRKALTAELEAMFPACNAAAHREDIILMLSGDYQMFRPGIDLEKINALLERHGAFAVMCPASSTLRGLRTRILQGKSMLSLVKSIRKDKKQRFFDYGQYSLYYFVYLCAKALPGEYGHDELMYLVHPAVVMLTRYDRTYKTELRDFLFYYIMNDCNIAGTAKDLYLHRNTAVYRLSRIKELTGIDLKNSTMRIQLVFSCLIIRYIEKYQQLDVVLKPYTDGEIYARHMETNEK